jgi:hypothetical protein
VNFAPPHEFVLWQAEHWPLKWLDGLSPEWQEAQSVKPEWLKLAPFQEVVL